MCHSIKKKTELLSPAGSFAALVAVAEAGADAVYAAGHKFGARAYADNLTGEELLEALDYLHLKGKHLYLTVNTLLKGQEIQELLEYLQPLYEAGLDAVIVQDMGVLHVVREHFPLLPIHASTQMSVTGAYGAKLMLEAGCSRIVVARELSLEEISHIHAETGAEIESFVHGALCYCYSGQCLLSSMIGGRSGNRGRCAQPCRLPYCLSGAKGSPAKMGHGAYLLSMKDLCAIDLLPQLIQSGVCSFKIEGRMKQAEYAAGVTRIYRKYLDQLTLNLGQRYHVAKEDKEELLDLGNRCGFTDGYYTRKNGKDMITFTKPSHEKGKRSLKEPKTEDREGKPRNFRIQKQGNLACFGTGGNNRALESCKAKEEGNVKQPKKEGKGLKGCRPEEVGQGQAKKHGQEGRQGQPKKCGQESHKEKIKGILRLYQGTPAHLMLQYKDIQAEAVGEQVQAAQKQPLSKETILEKMQKTGNTPFVFEEFQLELDENSFLTVGALNQLRRAGLERLQEEILKRYRRPMAVPERQKAASCKLKEPSRGMESLPKELRATPKSPELRVLAETPEQFQAARNLPETARIYLESFAYPRFSLGQQQRILQLGGNCKAPKTVLSLPQQLQGLVRQAHGSGKECYLALPHIFRMETARWFLENWQEIAKAGADGYLVRNYEEIQFLEEMGISPERVQGDYNIYGYSNEAIQGLSQLSFRQRTLPVELNFKELKAINCKGGELIAYGYQPVMFTSQCLQKNTSGCTHASGISYLRDRFGKQFPVRNVCEDCYNIIYNASPLSLLHHFAEIRTLQPSGFRLSFTIEGREEAEYVLECYRKAVSSSAASREKYFESYTNGHFSRGVE